MDTPILFLTGFMGAGKTTVGRRLAERLGREFVDLDAEIERHAERTISEIFVGEGEPRFRARETEALQALARNRACVVATGGGIVTQEENLRLMGELGTTVWVDPPFEVLAARLEAADTSERPLLGDRDCAHTLWRDRRPLYSTARVHVRVLAGESVEVVVERIVERLSEAVCGS